MSWFLIAIIGPLCYALTNHIDKLLLERYFKKGGAGTLILFSSILSILALPVLYFVDPTVLDLHIVHILILFSVGLMNIAVLWFYLLALRDDEASVVIVFYQLVPVIGYFLSFFILGELLTKMQLIAMATIILGASIISFEIDTDNNFKLRTKTAVYMLAASFFWALESVVFKFVAIESNIWRALFWEHFALVIVGVLIFIFIKSYRHSFISAIRLNSTGIISLNILNEGLYMTGNAVMGYAVLLAPVAAVLLMNSFQPLFVLAIGILLTLCIPKIVSEKIYLKHLWQKGAAILITGIGTYLLLTQ